MKCRLVKAVGTKKPPVSPPCDAAGGGGGLGSGGLGWSNGMSYGGTVGYDPTGSPSYYTSVEAMMTNAWNGTSNGENKSFFYQNGMLTNVVAHDDIDLTSGLIAELSRDDYWTFGDVVDLSVNSLSAYEVQSTRAIFNWHGFLNDYIHAADFGQASFYFPEKGDLVAAPLEGWDNVWDFFIGRTYVDDLGTTWNVGREGKIIGRKLITGIAPSPAKINKAFKLYQTKDGIWKWFVNGRTASQSTLKKFGLTQPTLNTTAKAGTPAMEKLRPGPAKTWFGKWLQRIMDANGIPHGEIPPWM